MLQITLFDRVHILHSLGGISALFFTIQTRFLNGFFVLKLQIS